MNCSIGRIFADLWRPDQVARTGNDTVEVHGIGNSVRVDGSRRSEHQVAVPNNRASAAIIKVQGAVIGTSADPQPVENEGRNIGKRAELVGMHAAGDHGTRRGTL